MISRTQMFQNILNYIHSRPPNPLHQEAIKRIHKKMDPNYVPSVPPPSNSKVVMVMHQGLGDLITIVGIIRYLSVCYDKVVVVAHPRNYTNVKHMYMDDNTIEVVSVPIDCVEPWGSANLNFLAPYYQQNYRVILGPCFAPQQKWKYIHYKQFYYDVGLDYAQTRFQFSYIYRNKEKELQFLRNEGLENTPYVFVHDESLVPKIKTLTNMKIYYPRGAGNMLDYCTIIEQAHAIHIKDSSFFCLATVLNTSQVKSKFVYQRQGDVVYTDYPRADDKWNFILPPRTSSTQRKRRPRAFLPKPYSPRRAAMPSKTAFHKSFRSSSKPSLPLRRPISHTSSRTTTIGIKNLRLTHNTAVRRSMSPIRKHRPVFRRLIGRRKSSMRRMRR